MHEKNQPIIGLQQFFRLRTAQPLVVRLLIILLLFLLLNEQAQSWQGTISNTFSGTILNMDTGEPISGANVYLSNTMVGTVSDVAGHFKLTNISPGQHTIVVRHVGFTSVTRTVSFLTPHQIETTIHLQPKLITAGTMEVVGKQPKDWQKKLNLFRKEFLGTSKNSQNCKILNSEVLELEIDYLTGELSAHTDSVLCVENRSLGYHIEIVLLEFQVHRNELIRYSILPKFSLLDPSSDKEERTWLKNRRETYLGSLRHFLSALARDKLEQEGFTLYSGTANALRQDFAVYRSPHWIFKIASLNDSMLKKISFDDEIEIHYQKKYPAILCSAYMQKEFAIIDTLGNLFTPFAFVTRGSWFNERIADLLPVEYHLGSVLDTK